MGAVIPTEMSGFLKFTRSCTILDALKKRLGRDLPLPFNLSPLSRGGGGTWVRFCWVCAAGLSEPHPIIVYSVANYRPHLSHFWANVIVISRTKFNASWMLNIKSTAGTIFQPQILLISNPCLPEFSYPKNLENLRPHSNNSTKTC